MNRTGAVLGRTSHGSGVGHGCLGVPSNKAAGGQLLGVSGRLVLLTSLQLTEKWMGLAGNDITLPLLGKHGVLGGSLLKTLSVSRSPSSFCCWTVTEAISMLMSQL